MSSAGLKTTDRLQSVIWCFRWLAHLPEPLKGLGHLARSAASSDIATQLLMALTVSLMKGVLFWPPSASLCMC